MKTYKEFKTTLSESGQGEYTPSAPNFAGSAVGGRDAKDSIVPLHDIGNPEAMGAVNAFIEQYTSQEYINPRQGVATTQQSVRNWGGQYNGGNRNLGRGNFKSNIPQMRPNGLR